MEQPNTILWECAGCGLRLELTTEKVGDEVLREIAADHAFFRPGCKCTEVLIDASD